MASRYCVQFLPWQLFVAVLFDLGPGGDSPAPHTGSDFHCIWTECALFMTQAWTIATSHCLTVWHVVRDYAFSAVPNYSVVCEGVVLTDSDLQQQNWMFPLIVPSACVANVIFSKYKSRTFYLSSGFSHFVINFLKIELKKGLEAGIPFILTHSPTF